MFIPQARAYTVLATVDENAFKFPVPFFAVFPADEAVMCISFAWPGMIRFEAFDIVMFARRLDTGSENKIPYFHSTQLQGTAKLFTLSLKEDCF